MHVKLKGSPAFYLVGFMGCGKSTVGRLLAETISWDFVDLDDEIERGAELRIVDIFENLGEPAFRIMEREALNEQIAKARMGMPRVVALGGGAFAQDSNRGIIEASGVSVWLKAPLDRLWKRVSAKSDRPLAQDWKSFEALYEKREGAYAQADFTIVDEGKGLEPIVQAIRNLSLI
ncbi:MAG: shikimate kinase [Acidobacteria bacterium]|nr:shikimate kinase [Acidobacteriota bacterium]